jgi:hypothetical protein
MRGRQDAGHADQAMLADQMKNVLRLLDCRSAFT